MPYRGLSTPDPTSLPQPVADRLLTRASELDASYRARAAVLDLRAAATEAGISERAFDAAYAELQRDVELQRDTATPPDVRERPPRRSRLWSVAIAALALIAVGAVGASRGSSVDRIHRTRLDGPRMAGMPVVEEAVLLRCLSPEEAAQLIAPLLDRRSNSVVYSPGQAPQVLRIRATPPQLEQVRSVLDAYERGRASSCTLPPPTR